MQLTVKGTMVPLLRDLDRIAKSVPKVAVEALNKTAFEVRDALKGHMRQAFDRPTPFTLNSLFVIKADERTMRAIVHLKDERATSGGIPANTYLAPQIEGGGRRHKRFEKALIAAGWMKSSQYAIPGRGVKLNQYGNVSQGLYTQVLSALRASPDPLQNETANSKARRKRRGGYRIFPVQRNGSYIGVGRAKANSNQVEMLFFFGRQPVYKARRFNFYGVAALTARDQLPRKIQQAWAKVRAS